MFLRKGDSEASCFVRPPQQLAPEKFNAQPMVYRLNILRVLSSGSSFEHSGGMKKTLVIGALLSAVVCAGCDNLYSSLRQMDTDGSGTLSSREISQGLLEMGDTIDHDGVLSPAELSEGFAKLGLLKGWDRDHNGRVNATDFVFLFTAGGGDAISRFSTWDKDGNGTLTNQELSQTLFSKFDLNRNGYLDRGEIEEVFVYYKGIQAYDKDEDGELSFAEIGQIKF